MQTRLMSFAETAVTTGVSLILGWLGNVYLLPLVFGIKMSKGQGVGVVVMFASISFTQKYVFRRLFEGRSSDG